MIFSAISSGPTENVFISEVHDAYVHLSATPGKILSP